MSTDVTSSNTLEQRFNVLLENYSNTTEEISNVVNLSDTDLEEAKEQFAEFVIKSQQIANRKSISERVYNGLATTASIVPFIGDKMSAHVETKIKDIRKESLNDKSLKEIANNLFDGVKARVDSLENTLQGMYNIREESINFIEQISLLDTELDEQLTNEELSPRERFSLMKMSSQVKLMIEKAQDKVQQLNSIVPVAEGMLLQMVKALPVSKNDLLSSLIMDAGVTQINAIFKDVKEIMDMNDRISEGVHAKTSTAVVNMLKASSVSSEDIQRIENNSKRRLETAQQIDQAVREHYTQTVTSHKTIAQVTSDLNNQRKLLNESTNNMLLETSVGEAQCLSH